MQIQVEAAKEVLQRHRPLIEKAKEGLLRREDEDGGVSDYSAYVTYRARLIAGFAFRGAAVSSGMMERIVSEIEDVSKMEGWIE